MKSPSKRCNKSNSMHNLRHSSTPLPYLATLCCSIVFILDVPMPVQGWKDTYMPLSTENSLLVTTLLSFQT